MVTPFFSLQIYTCLALIAFAANSVLCRIALKEHFIDATSFTLLRLISAVIVLFIILLLMKSEKKRLKPNIVMLKKYWFSSAMLFIYALGFSLAYIELSTGTGALILFGFVQVTLVITSIIYNKYINKLSIIGLSVAFIGLTYLVYPSLFLPSFYYFILMSTSGIAWGIYTLKGQNSENPLIDTYFNFLFTLPLIFIFMFYMRENIFLSYYGIILSVLSGGITSAIGYALWYSIIKNFSYLQSGVLQLIVPILATFAGTLMVNEALSASLLFSAGLILTGIYITLLSKSNSETS